mmetsp:Transcript_139160/g.197051  ORF Transcript_139160/g.197051 Transcript_139160/m.197051 type:complete len:291 (-) Transcript_139160:851-1723(-)
MNACNCTARCICTALKCFVPLQRNLAGACDRILPTHTSSGCRVLTVVLGKELPEQVCLLCTRGFHRKSVRRGCHLLISDHLLRMGLDGINPAVADAVAKLLLLSPENFLWQVGPFTWQVEGLPKNPLLSARLASRVFAHFLNWVEAHGSLHELPVQEGYSSLDAPCHHRLVGSQAVVQVQLRDLSAVLGMELFSVRCFVEVEVSSKNLVRALTTEDHFHARSPDPASHEVHWCGCTHSGDVEGLQMVNHIRQCVQGFLDCEDVLVMHRPEEGSNLLCSFQVWAAFQSSAE